MRLPARRARRWAASGGSAILLVSKRSWAAVETLLTFCPPGPEARTKTISMSFSSMARSREIRSMGATCSESAQAHHSGFAATARDPPPEERRHATRGERRGLIRLGRGWCAGRTSRLCGGLRLAADHDGDESLSPQTLCGLPGVIERDR